MTTKEMIELITAFGIFLGVVATIIKLFKSDNLLEEESVETIKADGSRSSRKKKKYKQ